MSRPLHWLAITVVVGAVACSQEKPSCGIRVSPAFQDLGVVRAGIHKCDVLVTNGTPVAVVCTKVRTSCSCAGYDFEQSALEPKEVRRCTLSIEVAPGTATVVILQLWFDRDTTVSAIVKVKGAPIKEELVRWEHTFELGTVVVGTARSFTLKAGLNSPEVSELALAKGQLPLVKWKALDDGPVALNSQVPLRSPGVGPHEASFALSPTRPGPGALRIQLSVGLVRLVTVVSWNAVLPLAVMPSPVILHATREGLYGATVSIRDRRQWKLVSVAPSDTRLSCVVAGKAEHVWSINAPCTWADQEGVSTLEIVARGLEGETAAFTVPIAAEVGHEKGGTR